MSYIGRVAAPLEHVNSVDQALDLMQTDGNNMAVFGYFPGLSSVDQDADVSKAYNVFSAVADRWVLDITQI